MRRRTAQNLLWISLCASTCARGPSSEGASSAAAGESSTPAAASERPAQDATAADPSAPPTGWKTVAPARGVSVLMPGDPEVLSGLGDAKIFAVKRPSGGAFTVMCSDLGQGATPTDLEETLIGMRRGKIGERKLRSEKKVDEDGRRGFRLEIVMETTKGTMIMSELLIGRGRTACAFSALIPDGMDESKDITRFFASATLAP